MNGRFQWWLMAALLILSIAPVLLPEWLIEADRQEFTSMYPRFGGLGFLLLNSVPVFRIALAGMAALWLLQKRTHLHSFVQPLYSLFCKAMVWLQKDQLDERGFVATLFLRTLALVYLIAFSSVLWQKELLTATGLIPVAEFAEVTLTHFGKSSLWLWPSLFWISQADWFIIALLVLNVVVAAISIFVVPRTLFFAMLWAGYLSIVTFGRDMFQFPWDTYLLELGFLAVPLAYGLTRQHLPRLLVLAFLMLFFRQWLSMAMTKLLWSDPVWHDLTYMSHFWLNQPSPTAIGCQLARLPMWIQKAFSLLTLLIETLIPAAMFFGRRGRHTAFVMSLVLSALIQLAGNFGFFNLLTVVAGLWCLDDRFFKRKFLPQRLPVMKAAPHMVLGALTCIVLLANTHYIVNLFIRQYDHGSFLNYSLGRGLPEPIQKPLQLLSHWRIVSPHGVFKGIPKERVHLSIHAVTEKGDRVPMHFVKGRDVLDFSHVAPFMNRLPFLFFYHSYGIEFRHFLRELNPNSHLVDSWMQSLLTALFEPESDVRKLADFDSREPIAHLVIRQERFSKECLSASCINSCMESAVKDSVTVLPSQRPETPLFEFYRFR
jgi:lipase maturation factor 1